MIDPTISDAFRAGWRYWETYRPCPWHDQELIAAWELGRDHRLSMEMEGCPEKKH